MKGIIIYEDYRGMEVVEAIKLGMVNYECKSDTSDGSWINNLSGIRKESTQAYCNKEDAYDFEIGALISLMKMCGRDKVTKACDKLYKDDNYKNALQEMTENNEKLMEENKCLKKENNHLKYVKSCNESTIESLENTKALVIDRKNELIEENRELKSDCEKLQYGYIDTDMIFCGGRQNGKQFTLLVDLFKKLDQKKVDAAYKEAYNTTLPVWQKETLRQMYEIRKIEASKYTLPHVHEWLYRIPTKRDEMWDNILAYEYELSKYVKVKKEDLETFAKECNEKKIFDIIGQEFHTREYWFDDDSCIFQIFRKPAGFICAERICYVFKDTIIDYLPPMRWDLFKKGRIAVRLTKDNYKEFYDICEKELGRSPSYKPDEFAYAPMEKYILKYNKKFKGYTFLGSTESDKIVNWEDVR